MGFKSLFKKKKKEPLAQSIESATENFLISRSAPLNGRRHFEEELEQVFNKFDQKGDGKICASELGSIMSTLGHHVTIEELNIMIQEVDSDGDGFIDLQEFIELNTNNVDNDEVLENLKHAFEVFDIDKNGTITAEELHNVLKSLGEECTLDDCKKMISGVDSDGNGAIDFDEFKVMMMRGSQPDSTEKNKVG